MKAIWQDQVIAQSNETVVVEGNHYFPPESIDQGFFNKTDHTSVCPWKGTAQYYSIKVGDQMNENAAWVYPNTKEKAKNIEGYFAFWKGVTVT